MELFCHFWPAESQEDQKVVFLHGMGGTGALWRPIAAALETHCSILAPDQRGHGKSQIPSATASRNPARYTPLDYGRDLAETLDARGFYPAFVVGHSMGVRTACAFSHLRPDRVRGLVLIDLGFSGPAGGGLGNGLAQFLRILPQMFPSRDAAREFMKENCPDPSIAQYLMAVSVKESDGQIRFPFDHSALIQTIQASVDVSVREWIREAGARGTPVLILRGAESLVWSKDEFEHEKHELAAFSSIQFEELSNASHGLPFEQRLKFVERLKLFFQSEKPH
jgi:pimeloyl-ACP methyl ester carboxylesterase